VTASNSGNGTVVPAGVYLMFPQANVTVIAAQSNTANATLIAANTGGTIISDGVNVYLKSSFASGDTVTLLATNGGQAVGSTYA
jgi:hypothetical protein